MEQSQNKMGIVPIPKLLATMGAPMIISMIVQAFYNIVDSYFVSNMKSDAIANIGDYAINALTLAFPIQMLIIAIGVGTGVGVNALLSRTLGEGDRERASLVAGNAVFVGICTYIVFLVFGLFGVNAFLRSQTSDTIVLELGKQYLTICSVLSFGAVGSMIYEKLLQSTGKTTHSTIAQLAGAITNIVLDPILIYGWLGLPQMGVTGAAAATVIGQVVTLALNMIFHYGFNREIDGSPRYLRPNGRTIASIYKVGAPAILMQALMSVMSYGINIIFGMVSAATVTAYGIYYKIQQFVFFSAFGLNNAMIPVIAFNYGKGDRKRVMGGIRFGMLYTLALMLIGAVGLQAFAQPICGIFALSEEATLLCVRAIRIVTLGYLFAGANIAYQGIFQALGHGVKSLIISLVRLIIVALPLAYALTRVADAANWVWLALPIAEGCGLIVAFVLMRIVSRQTISKI
ncbi:MAG: MATE family efflux transporter [Butyricicoccaceae bacterium]